jgi:hypothetical protein
LTPQAVTGSDAQSGDRNIGRARGVLDIDQTLGAHCDDDSRRTLTEQGAVIGDASNVEADTRSHRHLCQGHALAAFGHVVHSVQCALRRRARAPAWRHVRASRDRRRRATRRAHRSNAHRDPASDTSLGPSSTMRSPSRQPTPGGGRSSRSTKPSTPTIGVGSMSSPAVSL